jgi:hypothetical protein
MSYLHIAVTGAAEETRRRAVEALGAAGIEVYRAWIEPSPLELAEAKGVPNRDHLKGQRVKLTLNPWATQNQPTEGVFLGQGEKGLGIAVEGGGRYTFSHHEVADVQPVEASA